MVANLNSFLYALLVLFVASSHNPTADETLRAPANSGLQLRQQKGIAISGPSMRVGLSPISLCPSLISTEIIARVRSYHRKALMIKSLARP
jgi:hypothetical protein